MSWTKKSFIFVAFILAFLSSNNLQAQYRETLTGLQFHYLKDEEGPRARIGEFISMHMVMKAQNGTELRNSYAQGGGKPILFPVRYSTFDGDLYEAAAMLSIGDSASFRIPADSMYLRIFKKPMPKAVKSGEYLEFTLVALDIMTQQKRKEDLESAREKELQSKKNEIEEQKAKDEKIITSFIAENGFVDYKKTENGNYLIIFEEGEGELIKEGQSAIFHFEGTFLDGTTFESTFNGNHPASFKVGEGAVIPGWEETFQSLRLGTSAKLIIPSHQAYSFRGKDDVVPPYSILVFDVKIVGIK